ncbi:humpty dumpty [Oratosquilla oratoria]|uniref:humpty dumpty n=1 Tax=Oratosquilla oratoria TaxID=337810 RepID=UPI003F757EAE
METKGCAPSPGPGSPGWLRPDAVMKMRKLKAKRRALQARMSNSSPLQIAIPKPLAGLTSQPSVKRKNPFKHSPNKKGREEDNDPEISCDATLFQLLNNTGTPQKDSNLSCDFSHVLGNKENEKQSSSKPEVVWTDSLVVDWSIKSRMRFMSKKVLPWKHNFKTSEEASGTTGFVRCLTSSSSSDSDPTLDTSANAQFYQGCLVWQHPNIPWLQLFPRDHVKTSAAQTSIFGKEQKLCDSLHGEWSESLRSLHQLLRVRQCPYFYVCGPTFTCLFRAAGVGGISHAHALITPTTRGFRDAMKNEDIEFSMPLCDDPVGEGEDEEEELEEDEKPSEEEDREGATSWLEDLGLETSQFPNLNPHRIKLEQKKYKTIDRFPSSMVYVEGIETQGLINFLLNSKSCTSTTGPLAGVPPTLLAPVAFQGSTLKALKVKSSIIRQDTDSLYSIELSGPVLPHTVQQLTRLLALSLDTFSVNLTPVISTLPFSHHRHQEAAAVPQAFAQEGLIDCGLDKEIRSQICKTSLDNDSELPSIYREIKFQSPNFTWTDTL